MLFYSKKTKRFYNTIKDCSDAEKEFEAKELAKKEAEEKKNSERKVDAQKVESAYKDYVEAQKVADEKHKLYEDVKAEFIQKYGSFHMTADDNGVQVRTATDFFSDFSEIVNFFRRFPF